jgi:hypothetical protein
LPGDDLRAAEVLGRTATAPPPPGMLAVTWAAVPSKDDGVGTVVVLLSWNGQWDQTAMQIEDKKG